jgi:hypothetical protein
MGVSVVEVHNFEVVVEVLDLVILVVRTASS